MGAKIGDTILLPLDFSSYLGDKAAMKLFAIMIGQMDDAYVDFSNAMVKVLDANLPISAFGIDEDLLDVNLFYTLKETYSQPMGKFSMIFTNSAIVDCHYVFDSFLYSLRHNIKLQNESKPSPYFKKVNEILN